MGAPLTTLGRAAPDWLLCRYLVRALMDAGCLNATSTVIHPHRYCEVRPLAGDHESEWQLAGAAGCHVRAVPVTAPDLGRSTRRVGTPHYLCGVPATAGFQSIPPVVFDSGGDLKDVPALGMATFGRWLLDPGRDRM